MTIAFIGDLTVDRYVNKGTILLGGSSINSAIWVKRLGAHPSILAAVGDDDAGSAFRKKLHEESIGDTLVKTLSGKTSAIEIFVDNTGEHQWGPWDPGVLASYHLGDAEQAFLTSQDVNHLMLYRPTKHLLSEFLAIRQKDPRAEALYSVDFGDFTQFDGDTSLIDEATNTTDLVFFGLDSAKDSSLIAWLKELTTSARAKIVVTLAAEGSIAFDKTMTIRQKAKRVKVVDTTGAGDAFIAGFLVTYRQNKDSKQALRKGTELASQVVTKFGAY